MSKCDALLHIDTYPDPTSNNAIAQAVDFCTQIDATVTALAVTIDVQIRPGWLAEHLAGVDKLAEAEEARSAGNKQVWDVVEQWLKAKGRITPRRINTPKLIGVQGNPGLV